MIENLITIYADGQEFYSFGPQNFNMNDKANVYFAIYSSEVNKKIIGRINFGQFGIKYLPTGYNSFYYDLYLKEKAVYDIAARICIGNKYLNTAYYKDLFTGSVVLENDIAPITNNRRDIELVLSNEEMTCYADIKKTEANKHAFQYSPKTEDLDYAYMNLPLDKFKRLYCEFTCTSANVINDYIGIPLAVGFTKDPTFLTYSSIQIDLYHLRTDGYHVTRYKEGFKYLEGNYLIENPIYPMQPDTIGIIIDLHENSIEIYTEGLLFTTIVSTDIDFSLSDEPVYLYFISAPNNVFTGTGLVSCNFGTENSETGYKDTDFVYPSLVDESTVYSIWNYYNYTIKELYKGNDIISTIKVISDRLLSGKNIYCTITVPETEEFGPGLNKLWKSYNKVSDMVEHHNVPDKSVYDLQKLIDADKENNRR